MFLQLLMSNVPLAIVWVAAILVALTVHEFAHALVGKWRGDDTAERLGRLTLNPLAHIDIFGFLMLLVAGFGWAKPVPFDPRRLREPVKDGLLIALAGPFANVVLAVVAAALIRGLVLTEAISVTSLLSAFLVLSVLVNLLLALFNLIPVYPLDGSKMIDAAFSAPRYARFREALELHGPRVLFFLVLLSIATPLNVFFFVNIPAFFVCEVLLQGQCTLLLATVFGV